jgi:DNA-binding CsgD family transcriptional regulator
MAAVTLTGRELAQLETASQILLSPLDHEHLGAWRAASRLALSELLGADSSGSALWLPGEPAAESDPELTAAAEAYQAYYYRLDTGVTIRRRELRLEVFSAHEIYDWAAYKTTEMYADWNCPHRLFDGLAVAAPLTLESGEPGELSLHFYHASEAGRVFGEHGAALLRLLLPSIKAGAQTIARLHAVRAAFETLLDQSGAAVLLFDHRGRTLHATPAVAALLAAGPGRERVDAAAQELVHGFVASHRAMPHREPAVPSAWATVRTREGEYRLAMCLLGAQRLGPEAAIAVTLTGATQRQLDDAALEACYRLTPREAAIARLLAARRSPKEIADALGLSWHTVRRHMEHIYDKLGVHHRNEIGPKLRGA